FQDEVLEGEARHRGGDCSSGKVSVEDRHSCLSSGGRGTGKSACPPLSSVSADRVGLRRRRRWRRGGGVGLLAVVLRLVLLLWLFRRGRVGRRRLRRRRGRVGRPAGVAARR